MPENYSDDTTVILDCPTGRDYLSLDLSSSDFLTLTLDDRKTTLARGATRMAREEVRALRDALTDYLEPPTRERAEAILAGALPSVIEFRGQWNDDGGVAYCCVCQAASGRFSFINDAQAFAKEHAAGSHQYVSPIVVSRHIITDGKEVHLAVGERGVFVDGRALLPDCTICNSTIV